MYRFIAFCVRVRGGCCCCGVFFVILTSLIHINAFKSFKMINEWPVVLKNLYGYTVNCKLVCCLSHGHSWLWSSYTGGGGPCCKSVC